MGPPCKAQKLAKQSLQEHVRGKQSEYARGRFKLQHGRRQRFQLETTQLYQANFSIWKYTAFYGGTSPSAEQSPSSVNALEAPLQPMTLTGHHMMPDTLNYIMSASPSHTHTHTHTHDSASKGYLVGGTYLQNDLDGASGSSRAGGATGNRLATRLQLPLQALQEMPQSRWLLSQWAAFQCNRC